MEMEAHASRSPSAQVAPKRRTRAKTGGGLPSEPRHSRPTGRPRSLDEDLSAPERRRRERQRAYSAARYAALRAQREANSSTPTGDHRPQPKETHD
jgi:hypothetical protein